MRCAVVQLSVGGGGQVLDACLLSFEIPSYLFVTRGGAASCMYMNPGKKKIESAGQLLDLVQHMPEVPLSLYSDL